MTAPPPEEAGGEIPWLAEVLNTVAEFGEASLGLVAWELCLSEATLVPAWEHARAQGLIVEAGRDAESDEQMYRLAPP